MGEEVKHNHCYNCARLKRYYIKGYKKFDPTECGWCGAKRQIVDVNEYCDKFTHRSYPRKPYSSVKLTLNDLLTQISALREMLEEPNDEK